MCKVAAVVFVPFFLLQSCGGDPVGRDQEAPRQAQQRSFDSQPPPLPPPPDTSTRPYQHPVLRIPPAPRFDDPVRHPSQPAVRIPGGDEPAYPEAARRARIQGVVIVEVLIERDGTVTTARVLKPLPFGLDDAAIRAVRTWKYKPAIDKGRPVRSFQQATVVFSLRDR